MVTGTGGFIGSHIVERLVAEGASVKAFVHFNSRNAPGLLRQLSPKILSHMEIIGGDLRDALVIFLHLEPNIKELNL